MANTPPNITTPIINPTNQTPATGAANLGLLNEFIGTWNSTKGADATGYNVMPLPQVGAPNGYITKNFPYYEEITFAPIAGGAPNREGNFTQQSGVLFYEQRVYFATNPAASSGASSVQDALIHAENGSWLYHHITPQLDGPYGPHDVPPPAGGIPTQQANIQYNKQISVPHGNSILMTGGLVGPSGSGNPDFSNVQSEYRGAAPFSEMNTVDPASFLTKQLQDLNNAGVTVTHYDSLRVSTNAEGGGVSNIAFENRYGKVLGMDTNWYVEKLSNNTTQLQYIQVIWLEFMIGTSRRTFAHVDANTLVRV